MNRQEREWADASWNPVRARDRETGRISWFCTHLSEECRFCCRLGTGIDYRAQYADRLDIFIDDRILAWPLHWRRPWVFTLSMSDLFCEFIPDAMIDRVFAVMALAPQHTFIVLTKRAERMRDYMGTAKRLALDGVVHHECLEYRDLWVPLPNVWLGVSVEDQTTADERIPELFATPAAVRFISAEPLLGPVDLTALRLRDPPSPDWTECRRDALRGLFSGCPFYSAADLCAAEERGQEHPNDRPSGTMRIEAGPHLNWVIVGGESGPQARPMHPAWARSLRDQCLAASVPFFFKQWGEWAPAADYASETLEDLDVRGLTDDGVVRVGKRAAGRRLDGREWSDFPVKHGAPGMSARIGDA